MDEFWDTMREVERTFEAIRRALNAAIADLDDWMGDLGRKIAEAWDYLSGKMQELWDWISRFANCPGRHAALSGAALAWNDRVGAPVSSHAGTLAAGQLDTDDLWSGIAADRYRQALAGQEKAMAAIRTEFVDAASVALNDISSAIVARWIAMAVAAGGLLASCVSALIAGTTGFGAPAAPFIAAGGVVVFLVAAAAGEFNLINSCRSAEVKMTQSLTDLTAFPGGHWPKAVR